MYSTTHYHSTTHEVLCVHQGRAKLLFGGEHNPGKVEAEVRAGDAIVVPAGVGHRLVEDYGDGGGFQMVGSYPEGCDWDMCYGKEGEEGKAQRVKDVPWFRKDPLYGDNGPVLWSRDKLEERRSKTEFFFGGGRKDEVSDSRKTRPFSSTTESVLINALKEGRRQDISKLIDEGAPIDATDDSGRTALHVAADNGEKDIVALLLDGGADYSLQDNEGVFAIHIAAARGDIPVFQRLVDAGADVQVADRNGSTPLHRAAELWQGQIIPYLVKANAKVNATDSDQNTPLHHSVYARATTYEEIVELSPYRDSWDLRGEEYFELAAERWVTTVERLVEAQADVHAVNNDMMTPLHYTMCGRRQMNKYHKDRNLTALFYYAERRLNTIAERLIKAQADVNTVDQEDKTPLHYAVMEGSDEMVHVLIEAQANVNAVDKDKKTPLHYAVMKGSDEMVHMLIEAQANVNAVDKDKKTPLHYAARSYDTQKVERLIKAHVDVNAADQEDKTPLHYAAMEGSDKMVHVLVEAQANVNAVDKDKKTPLHYAAMEGSDEMVHMLIEAQANVNAVDKDKKTPLHYAVMEGSDEMVHVLIEAQANVNAVDKDKKTPLHHAASSYNTQKVERLIKAHVDVNAADQEDKTPLHYAVMKGSDEMVHVLIEARANVNAVDKDTRTPLHYAVSGKRIEKRIQKVKRLVKAQADVNVADQGNRTPLHYAVLYERNEIIQHLVGAGANVEIVDKNGKPPIYYAADWKKIGTFQLLLKEEFLRDDEVTEIVERAAGNKFCGPEIVTVLLEKRSNEVKITEDIVRTAIRTKPRGIEVLELLISQRGVEIPIIEEVMKAAAGNRNGRGIISYLLEQRGDEINVTEEVMKAAAGNMGDGKWIISYLLEQRGDEINVTEEVMKAAAANGLYGDVVMALLLEQREGEVKITKDILDAAVENLGVGKRVIVCLLDVKRRVLGPDHPDTLTAIDYLGLAHCKRVEYQEAVMNHSEARKGREKILGPEHEDTLTSMANLASAFRGQGLELEAEKLDKERLEIQERVRYRKSKRYALLSSLSAVAQNFERTVKGVLITLGLRESDIPSNHKRIRWTDPVGRKLFDDFVECEPGALQALESRLKGYTYQEGASRTTPSRREESTPTRNENASHLAGSTDSPNYELDTFPEQLDDSEAGKLEEAQNMAHDRPTHLMCSVVDRGYGRVLHQLSIAEIKDDKELFNTLRKFYHEVKKKKRPFWYLTTIHSIHFMKVYPSLPDYDYVHL
ncbi:hypothetical protein N0V90_012435 [Kalmusia sp. IMI 367209]|nr:hypothetical protein N0V90_012435 [Kalmusia sp. IMI 367209]